MNMNDWQPLGCCGLEALVSGSSILVRNCLSEQPHVILDIDDRGNILRLHYLGNRAKSLEGGSLTIALVKEKILALKPATISSS